MLLDEAASSTCTFPGHHQREVDGDHLAITEQGLVISVDVQAAVRRAFQCTAQRTVEREGPRTQGLSGVLREDCSERILHRSSTLAAPQQEVMFP